MEDGESREDALVCKVLEKIGAVLLQLLAGKLLLSLNDLLITFDKSSMVLLEVAVFMYIDIMHIFDKIVALSVVAVLDAVICCDL